MICKFSFKPGKGTIDVVFILRRIQEEYLTNLKKLYKCIVDLEIAFDGDPWKVVDGAIRWKDCSEALVRAVLSLYKGVMTKVKFGTHLSEEFV